MLMYLPEASITTHQVHKWTTRHTCTLHEQLCPSCVPTLYFYSGS